MKRTPKWGLTKNHDTKPFTNIDFKRLYYFAERNRIDLDEPITMRNLYESGILSEIKYGVRLLGKGSELVDRPLKFEISDAS